MRSLVEGSRPLLEGGDIVGVRCLGRLRRFLASMADLMASVSAFCWALVKGAAGGTVASPLLPSSRLESELLASSSSSLGLELLLFSGLAWVCK